MMTKEHDHKDVGLRGIEIADTNICLIEGETGGLYYRGYNINDLAKNSSFEEVIFLLIYGELPTKTQLNNFNAKLVNNRELPSELIELFQRTPRNTPSMNVLQTSISFLSGFDQEIENDSKEANGRKAIHIIAKMPTIIANWERIRHGHGLISQNPTLNHASNFLYMIHGKKPMAEIATCFNVALLLHAEHSFNASTFAARVIASTGADLYASISGAIGSLGGRLHGGANSRVAKMLLQIGDGTKVEQWVRDQFDQGKRIMGMGHAVYRTMDPRAKILKRLAKEMMEKLDTKDLKWLNMTNRLVEITQDEFQKRKGRKIHPNVDLYSASVYSTMKIPIEVFTPIFALARSAGWVAHALEEKFPESHHKPVLYRPSADYIGKYCGPEGCTFIRLEERESIIS